MNARWAKEAAASIEASMGDLSELGVESVEKDAVMLSVGMPKEELQDTTTYGYCLNDDVPTGKGDETLPYGIQMVQANSSNMAKEVPTLEGKHVVVCVIDSGLWSKHPDLSNGLNMNGCKWADADAPGGCPFSWNGDIVGHGTHVSGTIGAPANGVGVVGVIPKGARIYAVRVFNETGDVSQGEGYVYGSSLLTAYTQCEGYLNFLQANDDPHWRMVVSMSLGAPGPLSMEKLYFREAGARTDMLFVAAAGNNGSQDPQWDSYPGSYPEVMSVAAVDCAQKVAPFSQYNGRVDVAAPGVDVLSTLPQGMGFRMGNLMLAGVGASVQAQEAARTYGARHSGLGTVSAEVVDCGMGDAPCPVANKICMVQAGSSNPALKFNCDRTLYCASQGAVGVLLVPPPTWGAERAYAATLNCHPCKCWTTLNLAASRVPPVVTLSLQQAAALRARLAAARPAAAANASQPNGSAAAAAAAGEVGVRATVATTAYDYAAWSGTSMATPHVTGTAARIWANFPTCTAQDVRAALEATAKQVPGYATDVPNPHTGHGLIQMEDAYYWLASRPCAASSPAGKRAAARRASAQGGKPGARNPRP